MLEGGEVLARSRAPTKEPRGKWDKFQFGGTPPPLSLSLAPSNT